MVADNNEVDYLMLFKILLKEKKLILLLTSFFLFTSVFYNFIKSSTYNLDISIDLAEYYSLDVDCDSAQMQGSLIFCDSIIPTPIPVYTETIINKFNEKISTLKVEFPSELIHSHFPNNRNLNISINSQNKMNILEIKSNILNELQNLDNLVFNMIKKSRENKSLYLINQIDLIKNENAYIQMMGLDTTLQRDARALQLVSDKLNEINVESQVRQYEEVFTLYNKLTLSNFNSRQTLNTGLVNYSNLNPLQAHYNSLKESLKNENYVHSKNTNEANITDYKKNISRNILGSTLFGLFLSISLAFFRNLNTIKD